MIAGISFYRGVEILSIHPKSINVQKFLPFLDELRQMHFSDDIAIFVDRLSVHRSKLVQERMKELSIGCIFNSSYSPNNNPIENVFGIQKRLFKQRRLKELANGQIGSTEANINDSFTKVNLF